MNHCIFTGRLTKDPVLNYTKGENPKSVVRFPMAIQRAYCKDGSKEADFINIVAYSHVADFISKYFTKGMKIELHTRVTTGHYQNKDNQTVYFTEFIADSADFAESKRVEKTEEVPDQENPNQDIPNSVE